MPKRRTGGRRVPGAAMGAGGSDPVQPDVPTMVPGLMLWLAADDSPKWQTSARVTRALADADPVGAWDDLAGSGRHALQASATWRPLLKTGIQNGRPVIRFNGTLDFMSVAAFALPQPTTLIAVASIRTGTASARLWDGGTDLTLTGFQTGTAGNVTLYAGASGPTLTPGLAAFHVLTALYSAAASELRVDGGVAATGNVGANNASGLEIAHRPTGGQFSAVDFAEILIYNRALTTPERQSVERALGTKYSITVA